MIQYLPFRRDTVVVVFGGGYATAGWDSVWAAGIEFGLAKQWSKPSKRMTCVHLQVPWLHPDNHDETWGTATYVPTCWVGLRPIHDTDWFVLKDGVWMVARYTADHGGRSISIYVHPSESRTLEIMRMYREGAKPDEIGEKFGIGGAAVVYHLRKVGLVPSSRPHNRARRARLEKQLNALNKATQNEPVIRSYKAFAHASGDVWTPERMWAQINAETVVMGR